MTGADRLAGRGQSDVDALGDQDLGITLGPQRGQAVLVAALGLAAGDVDALAGIGALGFGQYSQRLARQRYRGPVAEVFGLDLRELVQRRGLVEGMPGRADRPGQRFL